MRSRPADAGRYEQEGLRRGGRSARRAGPEERRRRALRQGGYGDGRDEGSRRGDFGDDDARRIGGTAGHAVRRPTHRVDRLRRADAQDVRRRDEPVVMPGRNRAEDQKGDDNETGEAALRAHVGKSSHVRAQHAALTLARQELGIGGHRCLLECLRAAPHPVAQLHSYTAAQRGLCCAAV